MIRYSFTGEKSDQPFVGRQKEIEWLNRNTFDYNDGSFIPLVIKGEPGIGKTALVDNWIKKRGRSTIALTIKIDNDSNKDLDEVIKLIDTMRLGPSIIVVIDGAERWNENLTIEAVKKIYNYKIVSSLIITTSRSIKFERARELELGALTENDTRSLLSDLWDEKVATEKFLSEAIEASKGFPLAIQLLSRLLQGQTISSIYSLLSEPLYKLSNNILIPEQEIIAFVPKIITSANQNLVTSLQKQPSDLRKLSPREFEKLLEELLRDMGWEVELTKQTRDGGADILAYLNTDIGRILCLVEAKQYREDRKIGVDLVRTLYGTLCDAKANSAMLVTSSSFTSGAKEFQQKHQYQLSLKEYTDIVNWIIKYGTNKVKL